MSRHILLLTGHDLAVAFKNKTVYLMIFIPLFVYGALTAVDHPGAQEPSRLGLIRGGAYPAGLVATLEAAPRLFTLTWCDSAAEGEAQVTSKAVDGALLPSTKAAGAASVLLVASQESVKTLTIVGGLDALQRAAEGQKRQAWVGELRALEQIKGLASHTLPIWILMMVLLVGFLVVPPQVAEDKEKRWLLGLLQAPLEESQWLIAKVLTGMILTLLAVLLLHLLSRLGVADGAGYASYGLLLAAGSFCFSSLGLLLGSLCRTAASARTFGVMLYLPHLLPSALGDFSTQLRNVAPWIPSYQFFMPIKGYLMGPAEPIAWPLAYLITTGLLSCLAAHALLKRRWLMAT